jgi:hypothetical protein
MVLAKNCINGPGTQFALFNKNYMETILKGRVPTPLKCLAILFLVILLVPGCAPPPGAAHPKAPPGLPPPPGAFINKAHPHNFANLDV